MTPGRHLSHEASGRRQRMSPASRRLRTTWAGRSRGSRTESSVRFTPIVVMPAAVAPASVADPARGREGRGTTDLPGPPPPWLRTRDTEFFERPNPDVARRHRSREHRAPRPSEGRTGGHDGHGRDRVHATRVSGLRQRERVSFSEGDRVHRQGHSPGPGRSRRADPSGVPGHAGDDHRRRGRRRLRPRAARTPPGARVTRRADEQRVVFRVRAADRDPGRDQER
jgi:hypothetical protein